MKHATYTADELTRRHTAFGDFEELLNAPYTPSLQVKSAYAIRFFLSGERLSRQERRRELRDLANAYDAAQEARGCSRRVFRS